MSLNRMCQWGLALTLATCPLSAVELKNRDGQTLQADLVKLEAGRLTFELAGGRQHTIALTELAPTTQQMVLQHFKASAPLDSPATKPQAESASRWQKLFAEGLVDAQGKDVPLSKLEGKLVAVYFCSASCGICNPVTENLKHLREIAGDRIEVVAVCLEDSAKDTTAFMQAKKMPWPAVRWSDYRSKDQPSSIKTLAGKFNGWGTPTLVVLSETGEMLDEEARAKVQSLPEERLKYLKSVKLKDELRDYRDYKKTKGETLTAAEEQAYLAAAEQRQNESLAAAEAQLAASKVPIDLSGTSSWDEVVAVFHRELRKRR